MDFLTPWRSFKPIFRSLKCESKTRIKNDTFNYVKYCEVYKVEKNISLNEKV